MTHAALPGSPAIDAGGSCGTATDQRGIGRPQGNACDSGAFESRGFTLTLTGGSPQTTIVNTAFANSLALTVSSTNGEPVEGGQVTFSAPPSGAGLTFIETVATISSGMVSLPVTANGTAGSYQAIANASGNSGAALAYNLTNDPPTYLLTVGKAGSGSVTSTPVGINCPADCSENIATGTVITLTAAANTGSSFTGWSGACTNAGGDCLLTMTAAKLVTATFTLGTNVLTVLKDSSGGADGLVSSDPVGINCGAACAALFDYGEVVTLTVEVDSSFLFTGWNGGGCSGITTCVVTMNEAKNVTASFTVPGYTVFLPTVIR